jgi:hypothetical protein
MGNVDQPDEERSLAAVCIELAHRRLESERGEFQSAVVTAGEEIQGKCASKNS